MTSRRRLLPVTMMLLSLNSIIVERRLGLGRNRPKLFDVLLNDGHSIDSRALGLVLGHLA